MKEAKCHLYLSAEEQAEVIKSLIELKNHLASAGRYTDGVDDVILKLSAVKRKKLKVQYI